MSEYLREHPEVCFSTPKETHYFLMHDLRGREPADLREVVRDKYLDLYFKDRQGSSFFAEGSVSYLYAPEQLEPILKLWPRAKFMIGVRNPLEMVPSLHQRLFYNGDENQRQFDCAWTWCRIAVPVGRFRDPAWSRGSSITGRRESSASMSSTSSTWSAASAATSPFSTISRPIPAPRTEARSGS